MKKIRVRTKSKEMEGEDRLEAKGEVKESQGEDDWKVQIKEASGKGEEIDDRRKWETMGRALWTWYRCESGVGKIRMKYG